MVGHSTTGMVVERLVLDTAGRIGTAVAVAALSAAGNRMDPAARRIFEATTRDDDVLRRVLRFVAGGVGDEAIEAKLRRNRSEVAAGCRSAESTMFTETDFADRAGNDRTPLLVVAGSEDPGMDEPASRRAFLPHYRRGETAVVAGCGHYPMEERPDRVAVLLEAFFDRYGA